MARLLKERQVWVKEEVDVPEGPHNALIAPYPGTVLRDAKGREHIVLGSSYPPGHIVDYICVTHGMSMAAHGEDDECFW